MKMAEEVNAQIVNQEEKEVQVSSQATLQDSKEKKEEEKTEEKKVEKVERVYTVNLRKRTLNAPRWRRAKRAVQELRRFVERHMKAKVVKISNRVNELIWSRGAKNPVVKFKIKVEKEGEVAKVDLAE